jgi:hypothetical protein
MTSAVKQGKTPHSRANARSHDVDGTRSQIHRPIAFAGDERRWHIDRTAGEELLLGNQLRIEVGSIAVQGPLKAGALILAYINLELCFCEPWGGPDIEPRGTSPATVSAMPLLSSMM